MLHHKCANSHDFGKFNINHINLILLVYLQINAVCLYVPANERIIQTNANIYIACNKKFSFSTAQTEENLWKKNSETNW